MQSKFDPTVIGEYFRDFNLLEEHLKDPPISSGQFIRDSRLLLEQLKLPVIFLIPTLGRAFCSGFKPFEQSKSPFIKTEPSWVMVQDPETNLFKNSIKDEGNFFDIHLSINRYFLKRYSWIHSGFSKIGRSYFFTEFHVIWCIQDDPMIYHYMGS
jgi:hypothetical protein